MGYISISITNHITERPVFKLKSGTACLFDTGTTYGVLRYDAFAEFGEPVIIGDTYITGLGGDGNPAVAHYWPDIYFVQNSNQFLHFKDFVSLSPISSPFAVVIP